MLLPYHFLNDPPLLHANHLALSLVELETNCGLTKFTSEHSNQCLKNKSLLVVAKPWEGFAKAFKLFNSENALKTASEAQ